MTDESQKNTAVSIRNEVRERTVGYIAAAFSVVAGLAWNDAVKALIEFIFPLKENTLSAKFVYAVLVTIAAVIFTMYLAKLFQNDQKEK